jgi:hypothetical protein
MGMTMFIHFFFSSFFVFVREREGPFQSIGKVRTKRFYTFTVYYYVLLYYCSRNLKLFPARRYIRKYIGDVWFHVSSTRHLNDAARQSISTDSKRKENIKSYSGVEFKKRKFFGRVLLRRRRWRFFQIKEKINIRYCSALGISPATKDPVSAVRRLKKLAEPAWREADETSGRI